MTLGITTFKSLASFSLTAPELLPTADAAKPERPNPAAELMTFLQMSPQERMEAQWLSSHGMTKEELNEKSPEEQAAIHKQMADELKQEVEQNGSKSGSYVDLII